MPRPRKDQTYRVPTLHASSDRWRLRVGYHHDRNGVRRETDHFWPAATGTSISKCPPGVIAAAVAVQDQWAKIVRDWPRLSFLLGVYDPKKDWSRPVWVTADLIASAEAAVAAKRDENRRRHATQTAYQAAALGVDGLADALVRLTPGAPDNPGGPWEDDRLALLRDLRPALKRRAVRAVTIERAVDEHLADYKQRVGLKVGRGISADTFNAHRDRLLCALGLSTSRQHSAPRPKTRSDVPLDVSEPLVDLDESKIKALARFWQSMPGGVKSSRTVKNYLFAVRAFLKWCDCQSAYGWEIPKGSLENLTAESTERVAVKYDPEKIKKVLACGRHRLKLYASFGLLQGYLLKDIADVRSEETFDERGERYVKRERSKEGKGGRRKRKGIRKLLVKHWIAPEQAKLIDRLHIPHPDGLLLRNKHGLPLYRVTADTHRSNGVARAWQRACHRAGVNDLPFSQLRKIGFNAIKRVSGNGGKAVADIWAGHSGAIADHYDDGVLAAWGRRPSEPARNRRRRPRPPLRHVARQGCNARRA